MKEPDADRKRGGMGGVVAVKPLSERLSFDCLTLIPFQLSPACRREKGKNLFGKRHFVRLRRRFPDVISDQAAG